MNDFERDLAQSKVYSASPMWEKMLRGHFVYFKSTATFPDDGPHQRAGIDRVVTMTNAETVFIDEKVREVSYRDIALEFVSNTKTGSPGWVCKPMRADFIAYVIRPRGVGYLLPVHALQCAWSRHGDEWRARYGEHEAKNNGYQTRFCPVPVKTLFRAMGQTLRFTFDPTDLEDDPIPF